MSEHLSCVLYFFYQFSFEFSDDFGIYLHIVLLFGGKSNLVECLADKKRQLFAAIKRQSATNGKKERKKEGCRIDGKFGGYECC